MNEITNWIDSFFKRDFKKRFRLFISIPFLISTLFFIDFFILPGTAKTEKITQIGIITIPQNTGGTRVRYNRVMGYRYVTENGYKFSTMDERLRSSEVRIQLSPIYNTVKCVFIDNKKIKIQSGFKGINGVFLIVCNSIILISFFYTLLTKNLAENARLNLIFLNLFMFLIWIFVILKYGM